MVGRPARPYFVNQINGLEDALRTGGAKRDRTADLLNAIQALSQLSYGPDRAEGGI